MSAGLSIDGLVEVMTARPGTETGGGTILDPDGDLAWQALAVCPQTDPEAFFPENGASDADAKRVCWSCDVREQCLEYALKHDQRFGIWGGLGERERRKIKKQRRVVR